MTNSFELLFAHLLPFVGSALAVSFFCRLWGENLTSVWSRCLRQPAAPSSASSPPNALKVREVLGKSSTIALIFAFLAVLTAEAQPLLPKKKQSSWINGLIYDGVPIKCDLPESQQMKNIGSRLDGSGMCVFTSIEMSARYQGLEQMRGFRDWAAANYRGGGYPSKVDRLLGAWFDAKKITPIPYLQYEGSKPEEVLDVVNRTNRMAAITYGYSPRYRTYVAHMVNCVLFDKYGAVLDNNYPGDKSIEWMPRAELLRRTRLGPFGSQGSAWVFVWLTPGSPPPPRAASRLEAFTKVAQ